MSLQRQPKDAETLILGQADLPEVINSSFELAEVLKTDTPSYKADIGPRLKPATRDLYRTYSGVPDDEIVNHLHSIRDRAWSFGQYPCVGLWVFLHPVVSNFAEYENALSRVKAGASVLDLGCCFGHELRRLAADGAPTENMYASDIHPELWDIGYDLFRDRQSMKARFIQADIFDPASPLGDLKGKIDIFIICQFFHLFGWEKQIEVGKKIVEMSRPGAQLIGYHTGRMEAEESHVQFRTMFFHNVETFKKLWRDIGIETGTTWTVDAVLVEMEEWGLEKEDYEWASKTQRGLNFSVTRQLDENSGA
ncbi:hypothetical protein MMC22_010045 [Lobaria immixta]|nr:hypothetical protein [Lobaria immixta]